MSLLSWPSALLAAALTVPPLLLLYFLKLRRQPVRVSSTFLWRKAAKEVEVNAPFRLLRFSALLLLQLLLFLAIYFVIARPVLDAELQPTAQTILVIDTSASMNARDMGDDRTRLDVAKEEAIEIARRALGRGGSEVKLISFAATAQTLSTFESSFPRLRELIEAIEPTDQPGRFDEVLRLIEADMQIDEEVETIVPRVVLVSDGDVRTGPESAAVRIFADVFRYARIAPEEPPRNVGIVSMNARRDFDDPTLVRVFARLINAGEEAVSVLVTWQLDGQAIATETLTIPTADDDGPGDATLTRTLTDRTGALLSLRAVSASPDALEADDVFALVLPPLHRPRLLVVAPGAQPDGRLLSALRASDPGALRIVDPDEYQRQQRQLEAGHDVIVLDRVTPTQLPGLPSISIAASLPMPGLVVTPPDDPGAGGRVLSWLRTHALMRYAGLDQVVIGETRTLQLPQGSFELARGGTGTIIGLIEGAGLRRLLIGFEMERTSWPAFPGFAIFIDAAVNHLAYAGEAGPRGYVTTTEPATVQLAQGTERLVIEGPISLDVVVRPDQMQATLPVLPRVGIYEIRELPGGKTRPLAVNLADGRESQLLSPETILAGGERHAAVGTARTAPREIWPWFLIAALALLIVEWFLYIRQARQ